MEFGYSTKSHFIETEVVADLNTEQKFKNYEKVQREYLQFRP